jgi:UDP-N-acetylglucosamine diphosphorylase / glucose-1-phosphate thymidylyltransferase / UDP-N-acetylgalactosamine diphosphorylase / glucosamine-1-phosphate N-acetyltransferase / galactosamine-1-phosphate N-acetyltransferase
MKAIILAAGKGTRMKELTQDIPKPMICVHGKPILEHIIEGLRESGIQDICIITGYKAETIISYFNDGSNHDVRITYCLQHVPDGTGKAPELAQDFIGDDNFLLTYGDILVKPETYKEMIACHLASDSTNIISVTRSNDVTKGGLNLFDENFFLMRIMEKPSTSQIEELNAAGTLKSGDLLWSNAGIYIFQPTLFHFTAKLEKSPRGEYELTDAINKLVAEGHSVKGFEIKSSWVDVRDPEVLEELEMETGVGV